MPGTPSAGEPGLARKLGVSDAVIIGLGSMIGAGIFTVPATAAAAAGSGLLIALALAAVVAYANATSSAQLAAQFPESGGTYVCAGRMIGPFWGYLAGWAFVAGKVASLAAMALTVGAYLAPGRERPVGLAAVAVVATVDHFGVEKTARATRAVVFVVIAVLATVVAVGLASGGADASRLAVSTTVPGVLQAAGLWFFAFAGYARIATLGEEVVDPARVIPTAIPLALGLTLLVYLVVSASALAVLGPKALASSGAPLAAVAAPAGGWAEALVRAGAGLAAFGVLVSLLAGVSRTVFAMARDGHLPRALSRVHPDHRTPHLAGAVTALLVAALVMARDLALSISFSAFNVLVYYGLANLSAHRQTERRWPRWLQVVGLLGCAALAASLPPVTVAWGAATLAAGAVVWWLRHRTA
ncbi:MAG: amino acid permease [Actinomycetes bacterium]|jgi:APA family basic amino acid/polyamine antiporter|nr:MAG: amino acid permease [Actinomycetota bacterium]